MSADDQHLSVDQPMQRTCFRCRERTRLMLKCFDPQKDSKRLAATLLMLA
jgi:hypothetical protein